MKAFRRPLSRLPFDNRSLRELPVDASMNTKQRDVPNAIFALVDPTPVENPVLISYSRDVAENLLEVEIEEEPLEQVSKILSGSVKEFGADQGSSSRTAAHCYCGHQFGLFAGQLGDGATMYIGETVNSKGERWEIQFKGAGLTPFSRSADGRKVLRSSIREFLCSEHLHALGIPTTRALSICNSDSTVIRDILYDGHPRREHCAVIVRVAETFIRFGSFEIARPFDMQTGRGGPNYKKNDLIVRQLCDYVMKYFYPQADSPEEFVMDVTKRTAMLTALWQTAGFTHGVLNTDNMSIIGKTIDYGPFGFMERFDPHFIPNRSDENGRYAYSQQPAICLWNCLKLVETLSLTGNVFSQPVQPLANRVKEIFLKEYRDVYRSQMHAKLGIVPGVNSELEADELFTDLFKAMNHSGADFTQVFRALGKCLCDAPNGSVEKDFVDFIRPCLGNVEAMQMVNSPRYEARQIKMLMELISQGKQEEIRNATGLTSSDIMEESDRIDRFATQSSWTMQDKMKSDEKIWVAWLKRYAEFPKQANRQEQMNKINPRFVLRNHVAQKAIVQAERGDYAELNRVLKLCINPYSEDDSLYVDGEFRYDSPSEDVEAACAVSCSS